MKENHWDWVKALGYDEVIDLITNQIPPVLESCYEVIVNMCELITNTAKNLKENLKSIDMNQLIQYMQKEDVE